MRRVSIAVLLAVWLLPTSSAAQTASLPPPAGTPDLFRAGQGTYAPRYDRPSPYNQIFTAGGYLTGGSRHSSDPAPALSRYMARGIDFGPRAYPSVARRYDVVPSVVRVYGGSTTVRTMSYQVSGASMWGPRMQSVWYEEEYVEYSRSPYWYGFRNMSVSRPRHHFSPFATYVEPVSGREGVYVIPGCYLGDAPPQRPEKLPAGCKLENLRRTYY